MRGMLRTELTMCEASCYIHKVPRVHPGLPVRGGFLLRVLRARKTPKRAVEPFKIFVFGNWFLKIALAETSLRVFRRWKAMRGEADETECLPTGLGATVGSVSPNRT